jgi:transcriptional regulator with XRE-family HTH domain
MSEQPEVTLASYLHRKMKELNFHSERSFALYLGVSYTTVNRILRGKKVDADILHRISEALHVPVENLYRLAGYLPPEEQKTQMMREIERLLRELPDADQRRILDLVRIEYKYHQTKQPSTEEQSTGQDQKTG